MAAHGVDFDEVIRERKPWGADGPFKDPEVINETLEDGRSLIDELAKTILELGGYPDYAAVELTASPTTKYGSSWEKAGEAASQNDPAD
jgi:hypothetical protein